MTTRFVDAPEKWWLEDETVLLGSGVFAVKLRGGITGEYFSLRIRLYVLRKVLLGGSSQLVSS